jgi:hypothetical protein
MDTSSRDAVLRSADHITQTIDLGGAAIVAAQGRKRIHYAVLPQERKASAAVRRKAERRELAKILACPVRGFRVRDREAEVDACLSAFLRIKTGTANSTVRSRTNDFGSGVLSSTKGADWTTEPVGLVPSTE